MDVVEIKATYSLRLDMPGGNQYEYHTLTVEATAELADGDTLDNSLPLLCNKLEHLAKRQLGVVSQSQAKATIDSRDNLTDNVKLETVKAAATKYASDNGKEAMAELIKKTFGQELSWQQVAKDMTKVRLLGQKLGVQ